MENSVPQFLQQNDLSTNNELRRVAKPIVQKTLRLDDDKSLDSISTSVFHGIDKFLKTEPGAIYRVTIGFRPEYSLYQSVDTTAGDDETEELETNFDTYSSNGVDDDEAFWDRYDNYYPYGYNWQRRDDPGSRSYYNKDRWATRNILASNIGLTAKRGNNNSVMVAVSSILTTEPMGDIDLEILDYQQAVVGKGKSGKDGFVHIGTNRKPFLLVANNEKNGVPEIG